MINLQPLWKIEDELAALVDSIDTCPPEMRAELEARITEYVAGEAAKVDRIDGVLSSLEAVQANAETEIARLTDRAKSAERSAERLKQYVLHVLRQREGKPLKGHNVTFLARRTEAVVIEDLNQIPERFKRVTVTTDVPRTAVKDAIRAGQVVPGARLEQHEHLVRR